MRSFTALFEAVRSACTATTRLLTSPWYASNRLVSCAVFSTAAVTLLRSSVVISSSTACCLCSEKSTRSFILLRLSCVCANKTSTLSLRILNLAKISASCKSNFLVILVEISRFSSCIAFCWEDSEDSCEVQELSRIFTLRTRSLKSALLLCTLVCVSRRVTFFSCASASKASNLRTRRVVVSMFSATLWYNSVLSALILLWAVDSLWSRRLLSLDAVSTASVPRRCSSVISSSCPFIRPWCLFSRPTRSSCSIFRSELSTSSFPCRDSSSSFVAAVSWSALIFPVWDLFSLRKTSTSVASALVPSCCMVDFWVSESACSCCCSSASNVVTRCSPSSTSTLSSSTAVSALVLIVRTEAHSCCRVNTFLSKSSPWVLSFNNCSASRVLVVSCELTRSLSITLWLSKVERRAWLSTLSASIFSFIWVNSTRKAESNLTSAGTGGGSGAGVKAARSSCICRVSCWKLLRIPLLIESCFSRRSSISSNKEECMRPMAGFKWAWILPSTERIKASVNTRDKWSLFISREKDVTSSNWCLLSSPLSNTNALARASNSTEACVHWSLDNSTVALNVLSWSNIVSNNFANASFVAYWTWKLLACCSSPSRFDSTLFNRNCISLYISMTLVSPDLPCNPASIWFIRPNNASWFFLKWWKSWSYFK